MLLFSFTKALFNNKRTFRHFGLENAKATALHAVTLQFRIGEYKPFTLCHKTCALFLVYSILTFGGVQFHQVSRLLSPLKQKMNQFS